MAQEKEYFAFISYQRKDEEWADRLRNKLEHYRLPSSVRKQDASLPKEIRPIFRDALELAGGVLAKEIETALQNSKYLIVICSPNSAKSPWVNKEIQTFIDLGREDHIIPFIIDGTPFSDNVETECFPPALRSLKGEKELLGININELSRDAAAVKVVARMFGLKFDALWQRYEREKKKKRYQIVIISVFISVLALFTSGWILYQNSLLKEKDWILMKNQSIAVAEKANELTKNGDSYTASIISSLVLPEDLMDPDRPYTAEAEFALRQAYESNCAIINQITSSSVSLNNDGTNIVTACNNNICIWDVQTGSLLREIEGHKGNVAYVTYSPDCKWIGSAEFEYGNVCIWEANSGKLFKTFRVSPVWYSERLKYGLGVFVSFSPDNTKIIIENNVWDLQTGGKIYTIGVPDAVSFSSFSPDGTKIVSASIDSCVYVCDSRTGQIIHRLKGHQGIVRFVTFNNDGDKIASTSNDNTIRIWDVQSGELLQTLDGHSEPVTCAKFSNDGKQIISGSRDKTICIWDLQSGRQCLLLEGHMSHLESVTFGPDNRFAVSSSNDETVRIWNLKEIRPIMSLKGDSFPVSSISVNKSDDNIIAAADCNKTIRIWNLQTGDTINSIRLDVQKERDGHISNGKSNNSASDEDTYLLVAYVRGLYREGVRPASIINNISYSSDKKLVAAALGNGVYIWNCISGESHVLKGHTAPVLCTSFSPDNKMIVSSSLDHTVCVWDVKSGHVVHSFKVAWCYSVSFSIDSKYLLATGGNNIFIIDIEKETFTKMFEGHTESVYDASYSPDGLLVASASADKTIRIWDIESEKELKVLKGHTSKIYSVSFSPDGRLLVSASDDGFIRVWNVDYGVLVHVIDESPHNVLDVTFSCDGSKIISSLDNGTIHVWKFPSLQQLIDETRERFKNRQLTPEERRKYYLE